jgi:hypothetical protein
MQIVAEKQYDFYVVKLEIDRKNKTIVIMQEYWLQF